MILEVPTKELTRRIQAVAVETSVPYTQADAKAHREKHREDRDELGRLRDEFYDSLSARADALFELTDALLCAGEPVRTLVELSLTGEHRRGHGALYDGLGCGRIDFDRLRRSLSTLTLPRTTTAGSYWRSISVRGCARMPRPARSGRSATSTGAGRMRRS